jgi:hypothetical protein
MAYLVLIVCRGKNAFLPRCKSAGGTFKVRAAALRGVLSLQVCGVIQMPRFLRYMAPIYLSIH